MGSKRAGGDGWGVRGRGEWEGEGEGVRWDKD